LRLPVASAEAQRAFGRQADALQSVLALRGFALRKAEQTFQSLLTRAFSDDLNSDAATSVEEVAVA